jgi:hypothetical protein
MPETDRPVNFFIAKASINSMMYQGTNKFSVSGTQKTEYYFYQIESCKSPQTYFQLPAAKLLQGIEDSSLLVVTNVNESSELSYQVLFPDAATFIMDINCKKPDVNCHRIQLTNL